MKLLRKAADEEDAIEKLPVTPGPIVPAREQLGYLLLEQNQPSLALREFQSVLSECLPGRRGATEGAGLPRRFNFPVQEEVEQAGASNSTRISRLRAGSDALEFLENYVSSRLGCPGAFGRQFH